MPTHIPENPSDDLCGVKCIHLERVEKARAEAILDRELDRLADTFKILGDPSRLKIVNALAGGEMCVCDLAAFLELSDSAVSHQLRRLRDAALVRSRRSGQVIYYTLDDHHVSELFRVALAHVRE